VPSGALCKRPRTSDSFARSISSHSKSTSCRHYWLSICEPPGRIRAVATSCGLLLSLSNVVVRLPCPLGLPAVAPPFPSLSSGLACVLVRCVVRRALLVSSMRVIRLSIPDERSVSVSLLLGVAVPAKRTADAEKATQGQSRVGPNAVNERSKRSRVSPTCGRARPAGGRAVSGASGGLAVDEFNTRLVILRNRPAAPTLHRFGPNLDQIGNGSL
jgi:hypothetical protein